MTEEFRLIDTYKRDRALLIRVSDRSLRSNGICILHYIDVNFSQPHEFKIRFKLNIPRGHLIVSKMTEEFRIIDTYK